MKKLPVIGRLIRTIDARMPGNYRRTEDLLRNIGFNADVVSEGGEFETQEPLTRPS